MGVSMEKARSLNIADMSTVARETRRPVQAPSMSTPAAARVVPVDTDTMRLQRETVAMRLRIQEVDALVSRIQDAHAASQRKRPSLKAAVHTVQAAQHMERVKLTRTRQGLLEGRHAKSPERMPPGFGNRRESDADDEEYHNGLYTGELYGSVA